MPSRIPRQPGDPMSLDTHFVRASIFPTKQLARIPSSALRGGSLHPVGCRRLRYSLRGRRLHHFRTTTTIPTPTISSDASTPLRAWPFSVETPRASTSFHLQTATTSTGSGHHPLGGRLLVGSQNITKSGVPGQILRYKLHDGRPDGAFVASGDIRHLPPLASSAGAGWCMPPIYPPTMSRTTTFRPVGSSPTMHRPASSSASSTRPRRTSAYNFHPRGLVIGPTACFMSTSLPNVPAPPTPRLGGQIFVFDPETFDFLGVFIDDPDGGRGRPEPARRHRLRSRWQSLRGHFRANASDADAIRIYDGHTGVFIKEIELSTPPAPRAFAQGLLFGPDGKLFVPISGNDATTTGRIRKLRCGDRDIRGVRSRPNLNLPGELPGELDALVSHLRQNQSRDAGLRQRQSRRRQQYSSATPLSSGARFVFDDGLAEFRLAKSACKSPATVSTMGHCVPGIRSEGRNRYCGSARCSRKTSQSGNHTGRIPTIFSRRVAFRDLLLSPAVHMRDRRAI